MKERPRVRIFFSDFFDISPEVVREFGAFNISLINDLPLFIDPFLLFNSKKDEYQGLHESVVRYVKFLSEKAPELVGNQGLLQAWFTFPEVKQTWLGFARVGNEGQGLGVKFAEELRKNLHFIFTDFGNEKRAAGSHVEKVTLLNPGIGRDNISDFVTNLIKGFLLRYTETFALTHLAPEQRKSIRIPKVTFNYETRSWTPAIYELPYINNDFVILTPRDLLTKDQPWINRYDLVRNFEDVIDAVPSDQLRAQVSDYFESQLPKKPTVREKNTAIESSLKKYPVIIDEYIRIKESQSSEAVRASIDKVVGVEQLFGEKAEEIAGKLCKTTEFYASKGTTYEETRERITFSKSVIEDQDGYRIFYDKNGLPFRREQDLQLLFRLTWYAATSDVNREVNNGRGPVDFKISRGAKDKSLVEFKLASNSKLAKNLEHQVAIYQKANGDPRAFKVILFFTEFEQEQVRAVLRKLNLLAEPSVVLIDARNDNKPSASTAA